MPRAPPVFLPTIGHDLSPRKVVFIGLLIGACAMFMMQRFTLDASYWDFVWPDQNSLVGHVTPYSIQTQAKLHALKQAAISRGLDPVSADRFSLAAIEGMVRRQAGMLAYNRIFWVVGLAFLVIIPLLLLLKRPRHLVGQAGIH